MNALPKEMEEKYLKAKELIDNSKSIKVYSHNDCDGISAGSILSIILDRLGKEHDIDFVNLDVLDDLELDHELTIFSDLGSGQNVDRNANENNKILILDHHPPLRDVNYCDTVPYEYLEINPAFYGIDGSYEVCGGGLCYFLAKTYGFMDLSWIGVLSAVGDMQNSRDGKLLSLNEIILNDAIDEGYVNKISGDIALYGRQSRPLFIALSYFSDVKLPLTGDRTECLAILDKIGINRKTNDKYTTLSDLSMAEKGALFNELVVMLAREVPEKYNKYVPKLIINDAYEFIQEEDHSFLRDASEFSTAMNACGRNKQEKLALEILKGNRCDALDMLEVVTKDHRRYLAQSIREVEENNSIIELENIQYFEAKSIKPEVVGTVAGMILSEGNWRKPMIAFTQSDDENLKISLRCSKLLAYSGIHFGKIIRKISQECGGNGGGHSVACGAYIPKENKEMFIQKMNKELDGLLETE